MGDFNNHQHVGVSIVVKTINLRYKLLRLGRDRQGKDEEFKEKVVRELFGDSNDHEWMGEQR